MRMSRKTKRKTTRANVVFCSKDIEARAESEEAEEEDEEESATKCPPAECRREDNADVKGSPSIIQDT